MSDLQKAVNDALTRVAVIAGLGGIAVVTTTAAPRRRRAMRQAHPQPS